VNKQSALAVSGIILVFALFFFGRTVAKKDKPAITSPAVITNTFDIKQYIAGLKQKLTASQLLTLGKLDNSVTRGDVLTQQINANKTVLKPLSLIFIIYLQQLSWISQKKTSPLLPN
jgi:hypothetical protein